MSIERVSETLTAAGEVGSAAVSGHLPTEGPAEVLAIRLEYAGAAPASTQVIVFGGNGDVLVHVGNTPATYYPRVPASQPDGTDSTLTEVPPIADGLTVAVSLSNPAAEVTVTAFYAR